MMIMRDKKAQSAQTTSTGMDAVNAARNKEELTFVEQTHLSYSSFKLLKQAAKQGYFNCENVRLDALILISRSQRCHVLHWKAL
jgi:hypothetical protein